MSLSTIWQSVIFLLYSLNRRDLGMDLGDLGADERMTCKIFSERACSRSRN